MGEKPRRKTTEELEEEYKDVMNNPAITNMSLDYQHGGPGWRKEHINDFLETRERVENMDLLRAHILCQRVKLTDDEIRTLDFNGLMAKYRRWPHEKGVESQIPGGAVLGNIIRPILVEMWDDLVAVKKMYASCGILTGTGEEQQSESPDLVQLITKGAVAVMFFARIEGVIAALSKESERERAKSAAEFQAMLDRIPEVADGMGKVMDKLFE